jgi:predicted lipid-binding transport protein (Tim44 family)
MKNWIGTLFVIISVFSVCFSGAAEAKRLGGGMSSGMTRNNVMKAPAAPAAPAQSAAAPRPATPTPAATPPAPARSGMWGMLGGLALGVGLGALLSHFGMGAEFGGLLMMLLLGVGAVLLFKMFVRSRQPAAHPLQYAGPAVASTAEPLRFEPVAQPSSSSAAALSVPAGFDIDGFVRQAKLNFIRLQAANDAGNIEDIRQFTSPEMFAEIQLEFQERGRAAQQTDVVQLDAQLLDVTSESDRHIASVRFHGLIRETAEASPAPFDEVWHLTKPLDGSTGWLIAGIQQFA